MILTVYGSPRLLTEPQIMDSVQIYSSVQLGAEGWRGSLKHRADVMFADETAI
jgi:hypothetical protein